MTESDSNMSHNPGNAEIWNKTSVVGTKRT